MTQPTHTHRSNGGKFHETAQQMGGGALEGQLLVLYHDLDKDIASITTEVDWRQNWRAIKPDDCTICMGTGHDHIKGNKDKPCGHCYGMGKVRADGEAATDIWELATVATEIIHSQRAHIAQLSAIAENPAVQALLDQQRQQVITDSVGRQYQEWSDGHGHGPGGQRYTGD